MSIRLLSFPSAWNGSIKCDYQAFSPTTTAIVRCANGEKQLFYDGDDPIRVGYYYGDCPNLETTEICSCHSFCGDCCSEAKPQQSNPQPDVLSADIPNAWPSVVKPYINVSVGTQVIEHVMSDCSIKLNGLDPVNGLGVLHGLLLHGDHEHLCLDLLELGVDPDKTYFRLDDLASESPLGTKEELEKGATAVHFAASLGRKDCLIPFIDVGANIEAKTAGGLTPLDLAKDDEIKDILEKALASGKKPLAQLAKECMPFAIRHRMRTSKVKPEELDFKYKGKTVVEWLWALVCNWQFTMNLDEESLAPFKLLREIKYRYGKLAALKDLGEPDQLHVNIPTAAIPFERSLNQDSDLEEVRQMLKDQEKIMENSKLYGRNGRDRKGPC